MQIGVSLTMSWLKDFAECREAVITLEQAGFDHVDIGGHLVSTEAGRYDGLPPAMYAGIYRDPFVFFASLAPVTSRIRLRTSVLVLPMMPTVLIAKQAADLAILTDGRFELGVGIGWQEAEYRSLGRSLKDRGRRLGEQVEVLRRLWTEEYVTFSGEFHELDGIGLGQQPPPIPIWFGCGTGEVPLGRAGRLGDGWLALGEVTPEDVSRLRGYAASAERDPATLGITGTVMVGDDALDQAAACAKAGATELSLYVDDEVERADGLEMILDTGKRLHAAGL